MRHSPFINLSLRRARGDLLIESLIGMVLMGIIGMGVTYVTSRASVAQKDTRVQEIAINQMRTALMRHKSGTTDLCVANPNFKVYLPGGDSYKIDVANCALSTVTVKGAPVPDIAKPLVLSITLGLDTIEVGG